ncbi:MAG: hypothetical protein HY698_08680 [Deltaproteobacteria bacterium]|nr:hypothetical protein [Deltaproteobacteria bacterium]
MKLALVFGVPLLGAVIACGAENELDDGATETTSSPLASCQECLEPQPPTLEPPDVRISSRRADRLEVSWIDRTSLEAGYGLQRRLGYTGSWTTVATYGALTGSTTFTDTGLSPDALYCYRVLTYDASTSKYSGVRCAFTRDSVSRPVYWAQLEITTADVSDAGTDDAVNVHLNSVGVGATATTTTTVPSGSSTWLDYDEDDFKRGSTVVYELAFPPELADITQVRLEKRGTDGLCLQRIRLVLNRTDNDPGRVVFDRTFGATSTTCRWIDEDDGHQPVLTIPHSELRASPQWIAARSSWTCNPASGTCGVQVFPLEMETFRRRLEAIVGHALHFDDRAYWAPQPYVPRGFPPIPYREGVQVTVIDPFTLHTRIYLKAEVFGDNPSITLDGDLRMVAREEPNGTRVGFELDEINSSVDLSLLTELLVGGACFVVTAHPGCFLLGQALEAYIEGEIEDGFAPISQATLVPKIGTACAVLRFGDDIRYLTTDCGDLDTDGMADSWESEHDLNPNHDGDASEDPDGDGLTNLQEFQGGTDPHCQVPENDAAYCTLCGPCDPGEGDCDSDEECVGAYICRNDVGARYGLPPNWDVCECPVPVNDASYCTLCGPCPMGTGDCDSDAECAAPAVCRNDVGARYGLPANWDMCECPHAPGHPDTCRDCGPCSVGEGDCDGDAECAGLGVRCVNDAGLRYGFPENIDVCECPAGSICGLRPLR